MTKINRRAFLADTIAVCVAAPTITTVPAEDEAWLAWEQAVSGFDLKTIPVIGDLFTEEEGTVHIYDGEEWWPL